jgi:streptogramin lyase
MASGSGSVWAVDCPSRRLFRFDLKTGKQMSAIQLPFNGIQEEGSIAAGGGNVYIVAAGGMEIARVDATTETVADLFPAPTGAAGVRFGFGSLWVTSPHGGTVTRLDPRDGAVRATVRTDPGAYFLDVGEDAVWVMNNDRSEVLRIDPTTNTVTQTIDVSDVAIEGGDIAVGGGSVWARVSDVLVARIDPKTNRVTDRIGEARGSGSVGADSEAVWNSAHDVVAVHRVPI